MKKLFSLLVVAVMMLTLLTGCQTATFANKDYVGEYTVVGADLMGMEMEVNINADGTFDMTMAFEDQKITAIGTYTEKKENVIGLVADKTIMVENGEEKEELLDKKDTLYLTYVDGKLTSDETDGEKFEFIKIEK